MDKETKEPKCENDDEKPILIPDIASCKKIKPKPGILRLDIAKPRRPSGGSVEFRMEPALLGDVRVFLILFLFRFFLPFVKWFFFMFVRPF